MASDLKTSTALLTPEDLYAHARRFGVDLSREPYLLSLIKQAATTPNPPKRQHESDDESGGERYFLDQIKILRHQQQQAPSHSTQDGAWMAFEELVSPRRATRRKSRRTRTTTTLLPTLDRRCILLYHCSATTNGLATTTLTR